MRENLMSGLGRGIRKRGGSHRACSLLHPGHQVTRIVRCGLHRGRYPDRAHPTAGASGERVHGALGTARRECLDHTLIHGERHLLATLGEYVTHYNGHRPHQARHQLPPTADAAPPPITDLAVARVRRRTILNGLISEYAQAA
jgi:hypothetical protein